MAPPSSDTTSVGNDAARTEGSERQDAEMISVNNIFYVMESFKATATPVSITMILSALAANFVSTEESAKARGEMLTSSYSAIAVDEDASSTEQLGIQVVNGLVIIGVITAMTFAVVLLYKYNCMCFLKGYLFVSMTFLLGYFGGTMIYEAIMRYSLWITKISFLLFLYNFTIVGIYSLFVGKGVPTYVGQGYLIAISVILAWELTNFSDTLAWVLLILLALYDLYAVLTPCGPLNALVNLMGRDGAQPLPALLYEAQLPPQARRQPTTQQSHQQRSSPVVSTQDPSRQQVRPPTASAPTVSENDETTVPTIDVVYNSLLDRDIPRGEGFGGQRPEPTDDEKKTDEMLVETTGAGRSQPRPAHLSGAQSDDIQVPPPFSMPNSIEMTVIRSQEEVELIERRPTGTVPLAIAKLYKLPLVDGGPTEGDFSADELKSLVDVYFPCGGGRLEPIPIPPPVESSRSRFGLGRNRESDQEPQFVHYNVVDRNNVIKRTIFVGNNGMVYRLRGEQEQEAHERTMPSSIRLGLGDFIFYSVLVSKASLYSFTTFAACMVAILVGLFLTLLLLAIRGKALPALPISIGLGVLFYLPTRYVLEPFIHNMFWAELYV